MSKGVNKTIILGNLGNDPETKYLPSGNAVTNITVATSESWTDKNTNQKQERTEWHRICFFNKLADIAGEYLKKGSKVYIEGSLRTRKWQDQSGQDRYTTEIVASEMQMLDGKPGGGQQSAQQQAPQQQAQQNYQQQAPQQQPTQSPPNYDPNTQGVQQTPTQQSQQRPAQPYQQPGMDDFSEDIPF